jgi:NADPH2:quinone reductase
LFLDHVSFVLCPLSFVLCPLPREGCKESLSLTIWKLLLWHPILSICRVTNMTNVTAAPMMKAAVVGANGIEVIKVPRPVIGAEQMLVQVHSAALNRADLAIAAGHRHGQAGGAGAVAGLEWAGEVVEVGPQVSGFQPGDRVMCAGAGGYAEYAVADPVRTHLIPATTALGNGMSYADAACLPVALSTMHDALVTLGGLQSGKSVLIQGASSGVGIIGMQIARHLGASLVIGTSTNPGRRQQLLDYGAQQVVDPGEADWHKQVLAATREQGVDLIVDQVSGGVANANMRATRITGTIVNVGRLGGMHGDFDFDLHALRRINYIGATFRTRSRAEVAQINEVMRRDLWAGVEAGAFKIPIDREFALDDAPAAQAYMAANQHFGKILLAVR